MNTRVRYIVFGVLIALALGAGGWFIYRDGTGSRVGDGSASTTPGDVVDVGGFDIVFDDDISRDDVSVEIVKVPVPNLSNKLALLAQAQAEGFVADNIRIPIETRVPQLQEDPSHFNAWVDLAPALKGINDYEGARQAWEYALALRPESGFVYMNLASLYGFQLRDFEKAEENYERAIENAPADPQIYIATADFYNSIVQNRAKARAVIERGLERNPGNEHLERALLIFN